MRLTVIEAIMDEKIKEWWAQDFPCSNNNGEANLETRV
jgi:hypothetical protein